MNPSTISDLRAALKDLEEKKRKVDEQYRNVAAALRYFEESQEGTHPQKQESSASNLGDAIYQVLTAERPLHRQQIYDRLVEMGVSVGGQTPIRSMDGRLSTDPRFRNVGKGTWDLSETPVLEESELPRAWLEQSRMSNLGDAIYQILTAERPLHRRQVYDRLVEMGISVGGQTPINNVGAHLSTDPRFKSVERGVWDLTDPPVRDERAERRAKFEHISTNSIADSIYEILSMERPLHRRQVYDRLVEMGTEIPGRDPINNVGAHLSLDPRFKSVGGGVWDLEDPSQHDESSRPEPFDFDDENDQQGHVLEDDDDQYEADEEDSVPW